MKRFCLARHEGAVNVTFLDFSLRKIGVKELWTLKWHREFDTAGPWTKAGGARVEAWPQRVRGFRDY
jgi:prepilin-type processing-associated H-X9-DG protein